MVALFLRSFGPWAIPLIFPPALAITLAARGWLARRQRQLVSACQEAMDFAGQTLGACDPMLTQLAEIKDRLLATRMRRRPALPATLNPVALTDAEESLRYALERLMRRIRTGPDARGKKAIKGI
jgi:hypothetical protein